MLNPILQDSNVATEPDMEFALSNTRTHIPTNQLRVFLPSLRVYNKALLRYLLLRQHVASPNTVQPVAWERKQCVSLQRVRRPARWPAEHPQRPDASISGEKQAARGDSGRAHVLAGYTVHARVAGCRAATGRNASCRHRRQAMDSIDVPGSARISASGPAFVAGMAPPMLSGR